MTYFSEILGTITGVGVAALVAFSWPEPEFMTVDHMWVIDGQVIVERRVQGGQDGATVADWVVTVVGENNLEPTCQTVTGRRLHEGWSVYLDGPAKEVAFPIDTWVGEVGCEARLLSGDYSMFVTWTPRDGRSPVTARTTFTHEAG